MQMLRRPGSSDTIASRLTTLTPLDQLIPDSTDSDAKMELIFQARNQFFDGRCDAASVCFVGHFGRGRAALQGGDTAIRAMYSFMGRAGPRDDAAGGNCSAR